MTKKKLAVEFINKIRDSSEDELNELVEKYAGEQLGAFFFSYSESLLSKDKERFLENAASLMLMGYMIRANEEIHRPVPGSVRPVASALN